MNLYICEGAAYFINTQLVCCLCLYNKMYKNYIPIRASVVGDVLGLL